MRASGLLIAVPAGLTLGRLDEQHGWHPFVFQTTLHGRQVVPGQTPSWAEPMAVGTRDQDHLHKIWLYLLVGIGLGAHRGVR